MYGLRFRRVCTPVFLLFRHGYNTRREIWRMRGGPCNFTKYYFFFWQGNAHTAVLRPTDVRASISRDRYSPTVASPQCK